MKRKQYLCVCGQYVCTKPSHWSLGPFLNVVAAEGSLSGCLVMQKEGILANMRNNIKLQPVKLLQCAASWGLVCELSLAWKKEVFWQLEQEKVLLHG